MRYFLFALFAIPSFIFFPHVSFAREPLASELVTAVSIMTVVDTNYSARATSSDPFYITDIVSSSVDTSGGLLRVYCGTVIIYGYVAVTPTERFVDFATTPYKCTGAVWATQDYGLSSSKPSTVIFVGYSMSDTDFDEQPTSGGGGGGSSVGTDLQPETFATVIFVSSLAMLFYFLVGTLKPLFSRKKK